jgi:hypothetical protein
VQEEAARSENMSLELEQTRAALQGATAQAKDIDESWKRLHAMEMTALRLEWRRVLAYELQELKDCLEDAEPDISMALSRARNISNFLDRAEE